MAAVDRTKDHLQHEEIPEAGLSRVSSEASGDGPGEVVVSVRNVSKKFCKNLKRSMAYGVMDLSRNFLGLKPDSTSLRKDEFWALKDISFDLRKGEVMGVIGANGSGKTTLLRLIAGIFPPDKGELTIKGRVGALISVGAGFHPHMTGRENIYLYGTILGLHREEINVKFDDIVEFAEIGDFLDAPVSSYSSGMRVKLGFSVATAINPELLLIDEVLAVGDIGFRGKCYNYIAEIMAKTAVIFVSHSIPHINRYCEKILVLSNGRIEAQANLQEGMTKGEAFDRYYSLFRGESSTIIEHGTNKLISLEILDSNNRSINHVHYGSILRIKVDAIIDADVYYPIARISFLNRDLQVVAACRSNKGSIKVVSGRLSFSVDIAPIILNPGEYKLSLIIFDESGIQHLIWYNASWNMKVVGPSTQLRGVSVFFEGSWSHEE